MHQDFWRKQQNSDPKVAVNNQYERIIAKLSF